MLYVVRKTSRHSYDIPLSFLDESFVKRQFAYSLILGPALWCSKAAILVLYIRLFGSKIWLRYTSYGVLVVIFLFYWAQLALSGAFCTPHKGETWDSDVLIRCSDLSVMGVILGAVGVASDLVLLVLPLPVVYGLHLPPKKKLGLLVIFLMSGLYVYYLYHQALQCLLLHRTVVASSVALFYRVKCYTSV